MSDMLSGLVGGSTFSEREAGRQRDQAKTANNSVQTYQDEAANNRQNASHAYGDIQNAGTQDRQLYNSNIGDLMNQFKGATGVAGAQPGVTGAGTSAESDYGISPAQQVQLNNEVAGINKAQQQAVSNYQQAMAQHGIDPASPAYQSGLAHIQQTYQTQQTAKKSDFAQQALLQRQTGLQQLLGLVTGIGAQGMSELGQAAGGQAGLSAAALGSAGVSQGQAQMANQNASMYQQQANSQANMLPQLLGTFLGGGFNGAPKAPTAGTTAQPQIGGTAGAPMAATLPGGSGYSPTMGANASANQNPYAYDMFHR